MKMISSELDSFIFKFKQLWHSGIDAHLDIETHAGQAWVGLRCRLGQPPGPIHQPHFPSTPRMNSSPSRQRRRARRAAARKDAEIATIEKEKEAEEATVGNVPETLNVENVEVEHQHSDVGASPAKNVNDEICPDDVYHEGETIGVTPFRCHECRMLFLPKSYTEGNTIVNFESCRSHLGVLKCKHCAIVLVGLTKIGCHRQVCRYPA